MQLVRGSSSAGLAAQPRLGVPPSCVALRTPLRSALRARASAGSSPDLGEAARQQWQQAQERVQSFVKQNELDKKAEAALQDAQQSLRRAALKLESEHDISNRLNKTKKWVSEQARDIDQEWSVRRRLRSTVEDVQRMLPTWRRQFGAFAATPPGKAALTFAFVGLLLSGLLWQVLNVFWLLWWVSVPVSFYLASRRSKEAAAAAAQQQATGSSGASGWGGWGSGASGASASKAGYGEGPIVEAEWMSLDEAGAPKHR